MTEKGHKPAETSDTHESAKVHEPNYKRHSTCYRVRRRAVDLLFEVEQRGVDVVKLPGERLEVVHNPDLDVSPTAEYIGQIARGVTAEIIGIDPTASPYLMEEWPLRRLPVVDCATLRLFIRELLYNSDVPPHVAVVEGIKLASRYFIDVAVPHINVVLDIEAKIADQICLAAATVSTSTDESQFGEAIQTRAVANGEADKTLTDSDEMIEIAGLDMNDITKSVAEDVAKSDNGSQLIKTARIAASRLQSTLADPLKSQAPFQGLGILLHLEAIQMWALFRSAEVCTAIVIARSYKLVIKYP